MQMSINHDTIQKWSITEEKLMKVMFDRHQENVFLAGANDIHASSCEDVTEFISEERDSGNAFFFGAVAFL